MAGVPLDPPKCHRSTALPTTGEQFVDLLDLLDVQDGFPVRLLPALFLPPMNPLSYRINDVLGVAENLLVLRTAITIAHLFGNAQQLTDGLKFALVIRPP